MIERDALTDMVTGRRREGRRVRMPIACVSPGWKQEGAQEENASDPHGGPHRTIPTVQTSQFVGRNGSGAGALWDSAASAGLAGLRSVGVLVVGRARTREGEDDEPCKNHQHDGKGEHPTGHIQHP